VSVSKPVGPLAQGTQTHRPYGGGRSAAYPKNMPRVFVTDGSYRNALAAVRALGRDGFSVTAGERSAVPAPRVLSFWSRYCAQRFRYPDPIAAREASIAALAEHFKRERYDAAVPVGLDMVELFVENRERFDVPVLLPPRDAFAVAADKAQTFAHAQRIGVPIPRTVPARRWQELTLPVVFKHPRTGAVVLTTHEQAQAHADALGPSIDEHIAQTFIPGENGFGYFGFFDRGRERGYFMHERLMQYPKEGGPSVVARAVRNERLHELGRTLLESLDWHGVAMVEFKRSDLDGEFYLIEINPKLWGSLDLAIESGCNFPVWIARTLIDRQPRVNNGYREGTTYQWVVPMGVQSFIRYPEFRGQFVRNVLSRSVKTDVRVSDPLPTAAGLFGGLLAMAGGKK
jgi:predicted ATP-grasp superfamily ATP-dependent carboligase